MNSYLKLQSGLDLDGNKIEMADLEDPEDGDGWDYDDDDESESILGGDPNDLSSLGFTMVRRQ